MMRIVITPIRATAQSGIKTRNAARQYPVHTETIAYRVGEEVYATRVGAYLGGLVRHRTPFFMMGEPEHEPHFRPSAEGLAQAATSQVLRQYK